MPQQKISPTPSTLTTAREEQFGYIWHVNHECLSERVLFNTNSTHFQLCLGENKLHSVKRWWCPLCTLYLTNMLNWMFIELVHWNKSPRVDMLVYTNTLFWFPTVFALTPWYCMFAFWFEKNQGLINYLPHLRLRRITLTITPSMQNLDRLG